MRVVDRICVSATAHDILVGSWARHVAISRVAVASVLVSAEAVVCVVRQPIITIAPTLYYAHCDNECI